MGAVPRRRHGFPVREAKLARPGAGAGPTGLEAGTGRRDITDYGAGPVNDPLFVKALVLRDAATTAVIITVDAVALEAIGPIAPGFLDTVRRALQEEFGIPPGNVLANSSHCHGIVVPDTAAQAIEAVRDAFRGMVPVRAGAGAGREDRISENRRLLLADGREGDVRHAYASVPDEEVAAAGPIDPEIGILRLDRLDGRPLAVVYTFACHPIQGVPSGANTADITGFASQAIEDALGQGAAALFLQGCGGDINPVRYKDVDHPRDAEPLGNMLGLSVVRALPGIRPQAGAPLRVLRREIALPRADLAPWVAALEAEQSRRLESLRGTSLNLKTFLQLSSRYGLAPRYPSGYGHLYLHEAALGRAALERLDALNRKHLAQYAANVLAMEALTRVRENLRLLRLHHEQNLAAGRGTLDAELLGLRVGGFVLTTFPGELSVRIGLNLKKRSPHPLTYVAGCTNGYLYYAPTAEQLRNRGRAQEDSDCLLAPEWQAIYEEAALDLLKAL